VVALASHLLGERRRHVETLATGRSDHLSVIQGHILAQWSTYPAEAQLLRFASMDPDISIVPLDPYSRNSGPWFSETDHSERLSVHEHNMRSWAHEMMTANLSSFRFYLLMEKPYPTFTGALSFPRPRFAP
jgi:hypothetical protein